MRRLANFIMIPIVEVAVALLVATGAVLIVCGAVALLGIKSEQETQCLSIEGAKWSGENCYKNGIKLNFAEDKDASEG